MLVGEVTSHQRSDASCNRSKEVRDPHQHPTVPGGEVQMVHLEAPSHVETEEARPQHHVRHG